MITTVLLHRCRDCQSVHIAGTVMKYFLIYGCVLFCLTAVSAAEKKQLEVVNTAWQPFYGREMPNYGMASEIMTEAYRRKGYTLRFHDRPWPRVLEELEKGDFDATHTAWYTEERAKTYLFSESYLSSPLVFLKRKGTAINSWKTLHELKAYSFGTVRGFAYPAEFMSADYLRKQETVYEEQNIRKLVENRIDLVPIDLYVGKYLMQKHVPEAKEELNVLLPPLAESKLYVMFSKKAANVQEKIHVFNQGVKELHQDGTMKKILLKYGFEQ